MINGVGGLLGARVARRLCDEDGVAVLGLSRCEPPAPVGRAEWLVARLSGLQLVELLQAEQVDTVIHLDFAGADSPGEGHEAAVQQNVLGTMELLGACAKAGVSQVVIRSHSGVYGASPLNPALIDEGRPIARRGLSGLLRDMAEVEVFVAEFAAQHPDLRIATLRMAHMVGGWSPLMEYFAQPSPRTIIGFDPSLQLLHIDDAVEAVALAALARCSGAFNLAADDAICISQAIRLSGQQPMPTFEGMIVPSATIGDRSKLRPWPLDMAFLRHGCIIDTRRARDELGWAPAHSAADMIRAAQQLDGRDGADRASSEAALRTFLSRRR
ncbi:NAD-dependent epimerase/dehydratase family protein [Oscillochloris sp. ZM17-4]|uniref:NAD-dependent epimerase/dehydratase family protein n=1 Tax=Oscillochloris sp. ZM17-4 TaxID=2866714 RepID=UPI001C72BB2F|nr:NAD-dependent epimerase/dehydratase family protein [Oscillochloris sp. ZM17-4]MBX0331204.1 NAD-dependent epimerase/dehydratase family protein [Oscillochloris sp. ZM17-4]